MKDLWDKFWESKLGMPAMFVVMLVGVPLAFAAGVGLVVAILGPFGAVLIVLGLWALIAHND